MMTATRLKPTPLTASEPNDDFALMQRIGQGDAAAYRALVELHMPRALRFAERMLGSRADAEDAVQDVFTRLWRDTAGWKPEAKFSTWLWRVMFNACIDQKRRRKPVADVELEMFADTAPLADSVMIASEQSMRVRTAMKTLPDRQQAALALCYYEGISNAEAAETLGITLNVLQTTLFRARQKLKILLKDGNHAA